MLRTDAAVTRVFYLATPPSLFSTICHNLAGAGLACANSRVVLEKPLGRDLASAKQINAEVGQVFKESQIFRIDHYLGKEAVQNLLALRFGNVLFEPLWRREWISDVQITIAEQLGVGNRMGYYETLARCATCCKTICCNCCASSRWSRRPRPRRTQCATKS